MDGSVIASILQTGRSQIEGMPKGSLKVTLAEMERFQKKYSEDLNEYIATIKELDEVIQKIDNSWQGNDSNAFSNGIHELSENSKVSVVELDSWDNYFKDCLKLYGSTKEESLNKVRDIREVFRDKKKERDLL